uniref:DUF19 domain-containing protein n=1 Tax=Caenorhabditis japonica TaxID=281687 RepID=A0A8R1HU37_CAEJA
MKTRVEAYRDTLFGLTDEFTACSQKLEAKNSECYFSWDPFSGIDEDGRILKSFEKRDICKNYYGAKECLRLEIAKYCTVNAWRVFKKKSKEFGERIYGCDLRGVFVIPIRRNR